MTSGNLSHTQEQEPCLNLPYIQHLDSLRLNLTGSASAEVTFLGMIVTGSIPTPISDIRINLDGWWNDFGVYFQFGYETIGSIAVDTVEITGTSKTLDDYNHGIDLNITLASTITASTGILSPFLKVRLVDHNNGGVGKARALQPQQLDHGRQHDA